MEIHYIYRKMGRYRVETTMEEGRERAKSNHVEHPMGEADSPPIRRTDEGRIYGRIPTTDGGPRPKCMASKHLYPKYYAILYLRIAYIVSTLYTTLLQLPYGKRLAIR